MGQWRVTGLREPGVPLFIPRIEPVIGVVRCKENMRVRVVGAQGHLHEQQRAMHCHRQQQNGRQRDGWAGANVWGTETQGILPGLRPKFVTATQVTKMLASGSRQSRANDSESSSSFDSQTKSWVDCSF